MKLLTTLIAALAFLSVTGCTAIPRTYTRSFSFEQREYVASVVTRERTKKEADAYADIFLSDYEQGVKGGLMPLYCEYPASAARIIHSASESGYFAGIEDYARRHWKTFKKSVPGMAETLIDRGFQPPQ